MAYSLATVGATSTADVEKAVSDEQAAAEAKSNQELAIRLFEKSMKACRAKDWSQQADVMHEIDRALDSQPVNHLKYRARFVYSACHQMLLDVNSINASCFNKQPTTRELAEAKRVLKQDASQCAADIRKPDLSYDDPQPETDEEVAEMLRKEGKSEEDIKFILEVRKL